MPDILHTVRNAATIGLERGKSTDIAFAPSLADYKAELQAAASSDDVPKDQRVLAEKALKLLDDDILSEDEATQLLGLVDTLVQNSKVPRSTDDISKDNKLVQDTSRALARLESQINSLKPTVEQLRSHLNEVAPLHKKLNEATLSADGTYTFDGEVFEKETFESQRNTVNEAISQAQAKVAEFDNLLQQKTDKTTELSAAKTRLEADKQLQNSRFETPKATFEAFQTGLRSDFDGARKKAGVDALLEGIHFLKAVPTTLSYYEKQGPQYAKQGQENAQAFAERAKTIFGGIQSPLLNYGDPKQTFFANVETMIHHPLHIQLKSHVTEAELATIQRDQGPQFQALVEQMLIQKGTAPDVAKTQAQSLTWSIASPR